MIVSLFSMSIGLYNLYVQIQWKNNEQIISIKDNALSIFLLSEIESITYRIALESLGATMVEEELRRQGREDEVDKYIQEENRKIYEAEEDLKQTIQKFKVLNKGKNTFFLGLENSIKNIIQNSRSLVYFNEKPKKILELKEKLEEEKTIFDGVLTKSENFEMEMYIKNFKEDSDQFFMLGTISVIFVALLSMLIGYFYSKNLVARLRIISDGATKIANGKLNNRIKIESNDEIGNLCQSFNKMAISLESQKANLSKHKLHLEKSQAELREALLKAKEATQAKSDFLSNMSHEIRTPMNAVIGFVELTLDETSLSNYQRKNLGKAYRAARDLLKLINEILDVSKFESGNLKSEKTPFDLPKLIKNIIQILEITAREKGLSLKLQINPKIPTNVIGDPSKIRQTLINLAGNAIKFTEKGNVTIQLENLEKDNLIHFMIRDTGIGIPQDKLETIFQPFTQVDETTSRRFGGTGLGTTITKQLVEVMGGKIWLESEVGVGSTFHFTIPLPITAAIPFETDVFPIKEVFFRSRRVFRVLLAEDIEDNMILAKIRLEQAGHIVSMAYNGDEAIEKFKQEKFDIILMDVHMPIKDGVEATQSIRELEKESGGHIPIIALTASVMQDETKKYQKIGMDEVVAKPIRFNLLFYKMEKIVPAYKGLLIKEISEDTTKKLAGYKSFSVVGVDVEKGLQTWQNIEAYVNALKNFAEKNENLVDNLFLFLNKENQKKIQSIAHALRGLSGNLAMIEICAIAGNIENAAQEKNWHVIREILPSLCFAMSETIDSISDLRERKVEIEKPKKVWDQAQVTQLFNNILDALDKYSPYEVEPFLKELKKTISHQQLKPLEKCLDEFNFDEAKDKARKLAQNLGLSLQKEKSE